MLHNKLHVLVPLGIGLHTLYSFFLHVFLLALLISPLDDAENYAISETKRQKYADHYLCLGRP